MQLTRYFIPLCLSALLLLSACGTENSGTTPAENHPPAAENETPASEPEKTADYPKTFTHVMGETVLDETPTRIFAPYVEDALLTLGVTPVLKWSLGDYVQEYLETELQDVPPVDYSSGGPSLEAVLEANPDLIFLYSTGMAADGRYEQLSKIAPTYVYEDSAGDWQGTLRKLGELLDKNELAEEKIAAYEELLAGAKTKLAAVAEDKTFAVVRVRAQDYVLMDGVNFSGKTLFDELQLTPHPMVKETAWETFLPISLEKLPDLDADYIFYMVQGEAAQGMAKELFDSPFWQNLPAVRNGNAHEVEVSYWLAAGYQANTRQIEDVLHLLQVD
ncbi:ABC transporter substrate-binding protein [Paenibacillus daejeonensis]|uniref:ABC transporter substrate-binding protein n=1 Tax=Paenibacillus daejeonensis TaxID=135193 RepID=UPI00035F253A|nr:ABC transporter substrate-binding protein [Paenibacillus daejeonensis]